MSDCDLSTPPEVVLGASVTFTSGPFLDGAGAVINLTTWTVELRLQKPDGTEITAAGTPSGSAQGYLTYTTLADELDVTDVWSARFEAESGASKRFSQLFTFRVVDVLP